MTLARRWEADRHSTCQSETAMMIWNQPQPSSIPVEEDMKSGIVAGAICLLGLNASAIAGDALTDAMTSAYAPYRAALFRTNGQSQPEAEQAIVQARRSWQSLTQTFGQSAPSPYDRDTRLPSTLAKVAAVYEKAEGEIRSGQLERAHETLEAARELMSELRQRNGVVSFSDHMNAYHAQMELLLNDGPALAGQSAGLLKLLGQAGALEYLARRLRSESPAALRADAEFERSLTAVEQSVGALMQALLAQDGTQAREALGRLKKPYSQLFLKFG
jgi:hypothetical protein